MGRPGAREARGIEAARGGGLSAAGKRAAQRRVDGIVAFREELDRLEREGVLSLDPAQKSALSAHHAAALADLARRFDVDTTARQRQLSLGMRIASFLGALALCASVFLFVRRFWGDLPTSVQVVLLTAAPLAAVLAARWAAARERTYYFTALLALVGFVAFVLDLYVLGSLLNLKPSLAPFLAWAAFALALAYTWGLTWLLVAGVGSLVGFVTGAVPLLLGVDPSARWELPETFLIAGLVVFAIPFVLRHDAREGFASTYRVSGAAIALGAVFILSDWGASWLPLREEHVEAFYQVLGFLLSAGLIALGIRRGWGGLVHLGSASFVLFLFARLFDWWWDWMPRWLFFLVVGLVAVALIAVFQRLRGRGPAMGSGRGADGTTSRGAVAR